MILVVSYFNTSMGLIYYDLNQSACVSLLNIAEASCVGESCSTHSKDKEMATEEGSSKMGESSTHLDTNVPRDEWTGVDKEKDGQLNGGTKERVTEDGKREAKEKRSEEESPVSRPHIQPGPPQPLEGMDDSSTP